MRVKANGSTYETVDGQLDDFFTVQSIVQGRLNSGPAVSSSWSLPSETTIFFNGEASLSAVIHAGLDVRAPVPADQNPSFKMPGSPGGTTLPLLTDWRAESAATSDLSTNVTVSPPSGSQLAFNLINVGGVTPGSQAEAGFVRAAQLWQSYLADPVTINVNVGFSSLGPSILGQTSSTSQIVTYSQVRTALTADQTSSDDATAVASLSAGSSLSFYTNNSAGTRVFDSDGSSNNTYLSVNTANLKALGISSTYNGTAIDPNASNASISFSSDFNWDFDPSNGIDPGAQDFVGVAFHEIGHALGFVSGVDSVDYSSGSGPGAQLDLNGYSVFSVLDLYRYAGSGVRDLSYGGSTYFSLNGGATNLAQYSTGKYQGDGYQASHWKDNIGIGIMDPTAVPAGSANVITARDIQAFDAIGWNKVGAATANSISISDRTITEGNSGTSLATFTVTRSGGSGAAFAVNFATANGSALAGSDYAAASGTLSFGSGVNSQTISVIVNGDTAIETNETFFVNLSGATNGFTISDSQGVGTIVNDDAPASISISDASIVEGQSGTSLMSFTVTRSGGSSAFAVNFATANGSAVAGSDYAAASGTLSFGSGVNSQTISVIVNGDTAAETNEAFFVNLSGVTNGVTISDSQGVGTIVNDDIFSPLTLALSAFGTSQSWSSQSLYPRDLADVTGDGRADIVGFGAGGIYVALATGNGFAPLTFEGSAFGPNQGWSNDNSFPRQLADVDGDGRADIVGFGNAGTFVSLATGGGHFAPLTFAGTMFGVNQGWNSQDSLPRQLADVNGDGRADIVGFGPNGVYVSLATAGGHFAPLTFEGAMFGQAQGWSTDDKSPRLLADINGDGRADIVGFGAAGVYAALATGDGHFAQLTFESAAFGSNQTWSNDTTYPRTLADLNGDGRADIIGFGGGGVYIAHATAGGHFQQASFALDAFGVNQGWPSDNTFPRQVIDVTGDHKADIVGFASSGVILSFSSDMFMV